MPSKRARSHELQLSPHDLRRIAVVAGCDPRTVLKRVENLRVAPEKRTSQDSTVASRIDAALQAEGINP